MLAAFACFVLAPVFPATAKAAHYQVPTLNWAPCAADDTADCSAVRLPIDWARPRGETFELAVARRRAVDPEKRIGALLINPGGPGGSGVNFALSANTYFSQLVREHFDIVGFDPRGVGASRPVQCSTELLKRAPSPYPHDEQEFRRLVAYNRELAADCRSNTGPLFDHADTLSVVRDLDALRRALGERQVSYYGRSYGTLIGQQYAELFGPSLRAVVLDSTMDHTLGARDFAITSAENAEDVFGEFIRWCDRSAACALHGRDVAAAYRDLRKQAAGGSLPVTADQLSDSTLRALYGPDWAKLAESLALLEHGDSLPAQGEDRTAAKQTALKAAPFMAVFCQDWRVSVRTYEGMARLIEREQQLSPTMGGSYVAHEAIAKCVGWTGGVANPQRPHQLGHGPRALLLQGKHDPSTPYQWGVGVDRTAAGATRLVTYEGSGHKAYPRSTCTRAVVDDYLIELVLPAKGTRCAAADQQ